MLRPRRRHRGTWLGWGAALWGVACAGGSCGASSGAEDGPSLALTSSSGSDADDPTTGTGRPTSVDTTETDATTDTPTGEGGAPPVDLEGCEHWPGWADGDDFAPASHFCYPDDGVGPSC